MPGLTGREAKHGHRALQCGHDLNSPLPKITCRAEAAALHVSPGILRRTQLHNIYPFAETDPASEIGQSFLS
jgi:hypothetical protein